MTNPTNSEDVKAKSSGEKLYDEADKVWPRHREWADESPILKADYETLAARLDAKLAAAEQALAVEIEARAKIENEAANITTAWREAEQARDEAREALQDLHRDSIANDFNEHWDSYTRAAKIINPQNGDA